MREVKLIEFGDTSTVTRRVLTELILKNFQYHRATIAQLYQLDQEDIKLVAIQSHCDADYCVSMQEFGLGIIEIQVNSESLNSTFSKFIGNTTFYKKELTDKEKPIRKEELIDKKKLITQSHTKLFDKISLALFQSLMSNDAELTNNKSDKTNSGFKSKMTLSASFILHINEISCHLNISIDDNYSDYLLEDCGYTEKFSSDQVHRLIKKINVEASAVLSEKSATLQSVKEIKVGDTLLFTKKSWVSLQVDTVEINKAKASTDENNLLSLTHSTEY